MIQDSVISPLPSIMPANKLQSAEMNSEEDVQGVSTGRNSLAQRVEANKPDTADQERTPAAPPPPPPKEEELADMVESLNEYLQTVKRELQFEADTASGRTIIKVLDQDSKEVIRQIPPESAVELARILKEKGELDGFGLKEIA